MVPALALGVPDPAKAPSALPGHRLVLRGRGREALRLSALGSGLAVVFAIPLALPVTWLMERVYPTLSANLALVLGAVIVLLVVTEPTSRSRFGAAIAVAGSGALGIVALDWPLKPFTQGNNKVRKHWASNYSVTPPPYPKHN